MDKKTKFQQPSSKSLGTEGKKVQDVNTSKLPKSSRRRESPGSNNFSKNELPRKSNAQKTKNFEKKPKPKGYYHGNTKENPQVMENEFTELSSVVVPGHKKQNLNHLLNFHYAPRDIQGGWNHGRPHSYNGYHYNRLHPRKYTKDDFLQANCQFVVTAKGDYSLYLNDSDILVDWGLIQQIRLHTSDNLSCPICLSPPVAGKITRCGHVYCWPCILHYLALSDKSWRKCPICDEYIKKTDLKSVVEITEKVLNTGDHISLRLMRREKKKLIAMPVYKIEASPPTTFVSVSENTNKNIYSKLLLAENKDIMDILELEKVQLEIEREEDPDSPEICFIQQALEELDIRKQSFQKTENSNDNIQSESNNLNQNTQQNVKKENASAKLEDKPENDAEIQSLDDLCSGYNQNVNLQGELKSENDINMNANDIDITNNSQKFYYFYQADDGQNVFLHAMNVKMLEMQYGSLENCPQVISGKLIEKEVNSYTEDLRKRLRYLCHLPLTSQFEIVEIDLQPPCVSEEVLKEFEGQIYSRQKDRKRREREERKREKKITEEENKMMGKYPTPKIHIESRKDFPQFQPEVAESSVTSPAVSTTASSVASSPSSSWLDEATSQIEDVTQFSSPGPSFAQMLQTKGLRKPAWPTLNSCKKSEPQVADENQDSDIVDAEMKEYIPPSYSQSLGDALAQAFETSDLLNQSGKCGDSTTGGKKKKKKGKPTVLFATNMARAS